VQGHKQFTDKVATQFRLSKRVPRHNLYRRSGALPDWEFLHPQTRPVYSHTGQPLANTP
jgi:hypothetical protein